MALLVEGPQMAHLRIVEHLGEIMDRCEWNVVRLERLHPMLARPSCNDLSEHIGQRAIVLDPQVARGEPFIAQEIGALERGRDLLEELWLRRQMHGQKLA